MYAFRPQVHRSTHPQVHTNKLCLLHIHVYLPSTGLHVHRSTGLQVHRSTGPQVHRSTGPQVHRSTGPQVTGPQVHRSQVHTSRFFSASSKMAALRKATVKPSVQRIYMAHGTFVVGVVVVVFFFSEGMVFDVSAHGSVIIYALEPWILRVPVLIAGLRILIWLVQSTIVKGSTSLRQPLVLPLAPSLLKKL